MAEMFEPYPPEADKVRLSATERTKKLLALKKRGGAQEQKIISLSFLFKNSVKSKIQRL
jgi:hypothetical protein